MGFLWRWLKRLGLVLLLLVVALLAPIAWVETMCRPEGVATPYTPLLPPERRRAEARTLLTYPEWHIVHAYDDYAAVIAEDDPHDFGYLRSIGTFWRSLCALSRASGAHGGFDGETKQTIYVIGASFSLELALKAAYEETLGRLFAALRGPEKAPLDRLSAEQAAEYAAFLQQTPWYRWDFAGDAAELRAARSDALRDRERALALGLEYGAKAAYARAIAAAVESVGHDALSLRMIVQGQNETQLGALDGVQVTATRPEGTEIETPRYRALTRLLAEMAAAGGEVVEIAGNDEIMFTALSGAASEDGALFSFARQGYGDHRHLFLVPVADLAKALRGLGARGLRLEHVHDY